MTKKQNLTPVEFINQIPKAELHIHIEGSFEPELMFEIAQRNNIALKFKSVEELRKAYNFSNLQDFLDIYYQGAKVLINKRDFYDLTMAYFIKIQSQNVLHTEIFFDPQTHTSRGIAFKTVVNGIYDAMKDAKTKFGISSKLILCFLRHLNEEDAIKTFKESLPYKHLITGYGLDSSEVGNPPSKFKNVFAEVKKAGFKIVAHAGEEGPAQYIKEAIDLLKIDRIDHGNTLLNDNILINEIVDKQIPLTLCPLSNLKLAVIDEMKKQPVKKMLCKNILATINSDDPAYFGGYLTENYLAVYNALNLSSDDIYKLAYNSFISSFTNNDDKNIFIDKLNKFKDNNIIIVN